MNELMVKTEMTPIEIALGIDEYGCTTAKKLYEFLELDRTNYSKWVNKHILKNEYAEKNNDYEVLVLKDENTLGGRPTQDFKLCASFAKKLSMMSRSEKGEQARDYFIMVEDKLKNIAEHNRSNVPQTYAEALRAYADEIEEKERLALENKEMKPKALFADAVSSSDTSILVGQLAKLINQNGVDIGQNRLFKWLRDNCYLIKQNGENFNLPTQYSMNLGLMDVKERTIINPDGSNRITRTTKITGKGQQYFVNKILSK